MVVYLPTLDSYQDYTPIIWSAVFCDNVDYYPLVGGENIALRGMPILVSSE
jgi:hypothetical protein